MIDRGMTRGMSSDQLVAMVMEDFESRYCYQAFPTTRTGVLISQQRIEVSTGSRAGSKKNVQRHNNHNNHNEAIAKQGNTVIWGGDLFVIRPKSTLEQALARSSHSSGCYSSPHYRPYFNNISSLHIQKAPSIMQHSHDKEKYLIRLQRTEPLGVHELLLFRF